VLTPHDDLLAVGLISIHAAGWAQRYDHLVYSDSRRRDVASATTRREMSSPAQPTSVQANFFLFSFRIAFIPLSPNNTASTPSPTQISPTIINTTTLTAQSAGVNIGLLPRLNVLSTNSHGSFASRCSTATLMPLLKPSSWNPYLVHAPA